MALWASSNTTNVQEPKWLANSSTPFTPDMFARGDHVWADQHGWWISHPSRAGTTKSELLVAINRLSDKLGAPTIVYAHFKTPTSANGYPANGVTGLSTTTKTLDANTAWSCNVAFNQQVQIIGSNVVNLNITQTGAISSNITATYASGNGTNLLKFNFTTSNDLQGNSNGNTVITIAGGQFLVVPTSINTFSQVNHTANANMLANTFVRTTANTFWPFNGRASTILVQHPIATVTNLSFSTGLTSPRNTAANLFVTFSTPVQILTGSRPNITLQLGTSNTTNAIYFSGNGTANLTFNWTVPGFVSGVANVQPNVTISIPAGALNDMSANCGVNTYITLATSAFAANVTPT